MRWFIGAVAALIATAAVASMTQSDGKSEFLAAAKSFKASLAADQVPSRAEWLLDELIDELR